MKAVTIATDETTTQPKQQPTTPQGPPKSGRRRGFCCGCLVATVILCVLFALLLAMLFSSPGEIVARATGSLSGHDTVQQAATQLNEAQMRAMRGVKPTVQIELSDADINAYLKEHRDELDLPSGLEDPRVAFGEGFVEGSARTKVAFVPVRVRVKLIPKIVDGKLAVEIEKVQAGKLGVTGIMSSKLARKIGSLLEGRFEESGAKLKDVQVRPGILTVTGQFADADPRDN